MHCWLTSLLCLVVDYKRTNLALNQTNRAYITNVLNSSRRLATGADLVALDAQRYVAPEFRVIRRERHTAMFTGLTSHHCALLFVFVESIQKMKLLSLFRTYGL